MHRDWTGQSALTELAHSHRYPQGLQLLTLSADRAVVLTLCAKSRDAVSIYRHTTIATCCWYSASSLQFLSQWDVSWYYVEGRKCCGRNRSNLVAMYSVIAGSASATADILFTRNLTAVLSYWPDYWLLACAGLEGQAGMHCAHSAKHFMSF
jgi:hypothetical protein